MRWVIAGGGTGGHLFPGLAIAQAFMEREMGNEVLFIGTKRGIEARVLAGGKFPLKTIPAMPLKGISLMGKAKALWGMPRAIFEAASILKKFRPQFVLGVGGYASGPALVAAFLLGIKRGIQEQNVVPGMTNRLLRFLSQRIFVSFDESKPYFPRDKTFTTGNPIRQEILKGRERKKQDRFTILVFGGSAGAHRINQAVVEALDLLAPVKSSVTFIHQTGEADLDFVERGYQGKGFEAVVRPFFENMAACYQVSDLVLCRSGASTVAELAACGKASILVPYPFAANQHQLINAQRLVESGAAVMIRDESLNGPVLGETLLRLYRHPEERERMERAMMQKGRPGAAEEIVDHCYALLGEESALPTG